MRGLRLDRLGLESWTGMVMLVVSAGVGIPVIMGVISPSIPLPLWIVVFAGFFIAIFGIFGRASRPAQLAAFFTGMVLSWVLVITTAADGLLPILLVIVATSGPGLLKLWQNMVVVALNTTALVAAVALSEVNRPDVLIGIAFYLLIQIACVLSVHALQQEKDLRRDLAQMNVELKAATALLEESTRSAERLRISRELHDLMGHQLTVLTLELEAASHQDADAARKHIANANSVARSLLSDVRATVSELRSPPAADLAEMLQDVGRDVPDLDIVIEVDEDVTVDEEQKATLVRTVQELVTNTLRHSEARELGVHVRREERPAPETSRIVLTASDDGTGARHVEKGNGLRGIEERFAQVDGEVKFLGGFPDRSARNASETSGRGQGTGRRGFWMRGWMPVR